MLLVRLQVEGCMDVIVKSVPGDINAHKVVAERSGLESGSCAHKTVL